MEYHALITGLPTVSAGDEKPKVTLPQFKANGLPQLSAADQRLVGLYLLRYDNRNLTALLAGKDEHDDRALYSRAELEEAVSAVRRSDMTARPLPGYIYDFVAWYDGMDGNGPLPEDELWRLYFAHALKTGNEFVRRWFEFERNVNNIVVALTARKVGIDATHSLIGDDDVTQRLRTSREADFGLKTELDYFGNVQAVTGFADPVEKERALDELKWRWLDDETFFHYFSVEKIFAFVVKLDIIERWSRLDDEVGQKLFRQLIEDIKGEAQVPAEFK